MPCPDLFSQATSLALEFPSLKALVASRAACDLGRLRLEELSPFSEEEDLQQHRRRYDEVRRMLAARPLVPWRERPFAPLLGALQAGGHGLDGRDLVELGVLLQIVADGIERVGSTDPPCEALVERCATVPDLTDLRRQLKKTFDARGEIREDASPRLAEIRASSRRVRQSLYDRLRTSVNELRDNLSEETIPMRAGRLVLKLQAGSKGRAKGLIHGRSASGRSFYFEPLEVVEENNHLQQIGEEEAAEKRRILAELVRKLHEHLDDLHQQAELAAEFDHLQALARFAERCGGRMAELAPRHELQLVAARHPLLDPQLAEEREEALGTPGHRGDIVPLDLELSAVRRALVITGPNAGGKTVALKTLGLLALANQCGLPIPVEKGSRLPFFQGIVATVGDDQDLLTDRSTFSGRLLRLNEAWEMAGPETLVLLDELGSGTDPEEGAALSTAVLEGFLRRETLLLITTHLSQVAATALEAENAFCAAMLFDSSTGQPTYRLLPGPPGGSEALALARRLGLPGEWLERAEELLGSEHRDLRRLLAELEGARDELGQTQERLEQELSDAELLRRRLAEQEEALLAERKTLSKKLRAELEAFRDETRRKLGEEVERLRQQLDRGRRKGLAAEAVERLFEEAPKILPEVEEEPAGPLRVGEKARHRKLGWEGILEKLERGRAQVRVQGKLFKCREEDLRPAGKRPTPAHTKGPAHPTVRSRTPMRDLDVAPKELMLIGQRVEPALEALDRFLDQALLGAFGAVRIVHGHGSGRLRSAVRDHLRRHPAVQGQRPGAANEGGDGATVVELAGD